MTRHIAVFIVITLVLITVTIPGTIEEFNDSLFNQIYYSFMIVAAGVYYILFALKIRQLRRDDED
ncbi:hypothetical protein KP77_04450 [Jeotgalibacillus alimentarius]|uniref:Uncharacterized protein n=1 Tax=Jeotgalibacillus alimentarius TaxID=135826 RepID=A0A0C2SHN1_9BACL|nr:hypothetical protein [Jeotgalibacillus alimentarius]KIL53469.1 hypothetical protein KP77_04450 [Jeotgalibacillus alimentarius]